jgi:hypothetical protein
MNDGEFLSMATVSALATFERTKFILNSSDGESAWMIRNKRILAEVLEVACHWTAARILHAAEGVNKMGPNKSTCLDVSKSDVTVDTRTHIADMSLPGGKSEKPAVSILGRKELHRESWLDSSEDSFESYQTIEVEAAPVSKSGVRKRSKKGRPLKRSVNMRALHRMGAPSEDIQDIMRITTEKVTQLQESQGILQAALRDSISKVPALISYQTPPIKGALKQAEAPGDLLSPMGDSQAPHHG